MHSSAYFPPTPARADIQSREAGAKPVVVDGMQIGSIQHLSPTCKLLLPTEGAAQAETRATAAQIDAVALEQAADEPGSHSLDPLVKAILHLKKQGVTLRTAQAVRHG